MNKVPTAEKGQKFKLMPAVYYDKNANSNVHCFVFILTRFQLHNLCIMIAKFS
jgi:hypothetical protein